MMTAVNDIKKAEQWLKTRKDYTLCRESYSQQFLGLSGHLSLRFSDRTMNHQHSLLFEAP
jgi:hypothetical protein